MNAIYGYMNSIDKEAAAIDAEVAFIEAKCAAESAVTDIAHEVRLKEIEYKAITEGYDMDTLIDIYEKERAMYFGEAEGGEKESFFQGILDWLRGIINAIFNIKEGANDDVEKLKKSGVSKIALDYGSNLPSVIDGLNGPINNLKNAVATQKTKKIDLKKIGLGALGTIGAVLAWKTFKDKFFGKSTELVPIEQAEKIREDSRKALKKVGKELQALEGVVQNTKPEDVLEENKAAMKQIQAATLRIGGIVKGIEGVVQKDFTIPGGALDKMMDNPSDEKKSEGDNQSEPKKKSGNALQNKLDAKGDEKANENYKNAAEKGGKKDGRSLQDRLEAKADKKMYDDAKNVPKYEQYKKNLAGYAEDLKEQLEEMPKEKEKGTSAKYNKAIESIKSIANAAIGKIESGKLASNNNKTAYNGLKAQYDQWTKAYMTAGAKKELKVEGPKGYQATMLHNIVGKILSMGYFDGGEHVQENAYIDQYRMSDIIMECDETSDVTMDDMAALLEWSTEDDIEQLAELVNQL